jgi:hypothetical protein
MWMTHMPAEISVPAAAPDPGQSGDIVGLSTG